MDSESSTTQTPLSAWKPSAAKDSPPTTPIKLDANPDVQIRNYGHKGRGLQWSPSDGKKVVKGEADEDARHAE